MSIGGVLHRSGGHVVTGDGVVVRAGERGRHVQGLVDGTAVERRSRVDAIVGDRELGRPDRRVTDVANGVGVGDHVARLGVRRGVGALGEVDGRLGIAGVRVDAGHQFSLAEVDDHAALVDGL